MNTATSFHCLPCHTYSMLCIQPCRERLHFKKYCHHWTC